MLSWCQSLQWTNLPLWVQRDSLTTKTLRRCLNMKTKHWSQHYLVDCTRNFPCSVVMLWNKRRGTNPNQNYEQMDQWTLNVQQFKAHDSNYSYSRQGTLIKKIFISSTSLKNVSILLAQSRSCHCQGAELFQKYCVHSPPLLWIILMGKSVLSGYALEKSQRSRSCYKEAVQGVSDLLKNTSEGRFL